jgi:hypothetical protein
MIEQYIRSIIDRTRQRIGDASDCSIVKRHFLLAAPLSKRDMIVLRIRHSNWAVRSTVIECDQLLPLLGRWPVEEGGMSRDERGIGRFVLYFYHFTLLEWYLSLLGYFMGLVGIDLVSARVRRGLVPEIYFAILFHHRPCSSLTLYLQFSNYFANLLQLPITGLVRTQALFMPRLIQSKSFPSVKVTDIPFQFV